MSNFRVTQLPKGRFLKTGVVAGGYEASVNGMFSISDLLIKDRKTSRAMPSFGSYLLEKGGVCLLAVAGRQSPTLRCLYLKSVCYVSRSPSVEQCDPESF